MYQKHAKEKEKKEKGFSIMLTGRLRALYNSNKDTQTPRYTQTKITTLLGRAAGKNKCPLATCIRSSHPTRAPPFFPPMRF
jgi:hypothetical protein